MPPAPGPYHAPLLIGGVPHDLGHLDPVRLEVSSEKLGRLVSAWCRFTTHTFTRAYQAGDPGPPILDEGRRPRTFCPDRYALSHHLPTAVGLLAQPRCYVWETASERNWLHRAELQISDGQGTSYQVFFSLKRAAAGADFDLELTVESAYAFDPRRPPKLRGRMLFAGLATMTVQGQKPHTQHARKR